MYLIRTVKPRYKEIPRDTVNVFISMGARYTNTFTVSNFGQVEDYRSIYRGFCCSRVCYIWVYPFIEYIVNKVILKSNVNFAQLQQLLTSSGQQSSDCNSTSNYC